MMQKPNPTIQLQIKKKDRIISLKDIAKRIDKALEKTRKFYNTVPQGTSFDEFVYCLMSCLPKTIEFKPVYYSVMTIAGKPLTRDLIRQTAWRLAGNVDKLKRRIVIPPWTSQTLTEWVPIKILRMNRGKMGKYKKLGYYIDYRILAGTPAGLKVTTFWSDLMCRYVAKHVGFSKNKGRNKFPYTNGIELVGLELFVEMTPNKSTVDKPGFERIFVPAVSKTRNRKILKRRIREDKCPLGYTLTQMPCYKCPAGADMCMAACRPITLKVASCPRCMEESFFDPTSTSVVCISCNEKECLGF